MSLETLLYSTNHQYYPFLQSLSFSYDLGSRKTILRHAWKLP